MKDIIIERIKINSFVVMAGLNSLTRPFIFLVIVFAVGWAA